MIYCAVFGKATRLSKNMRIRLLLKTMTNNYWDAIFCQLELFKEDILRWVTYSVAKF